MLNFQKIIIEYFVQELECVYVRNYGITETPYGEIVAWAGRLALENIANSDMLYHDVEHTMMVTLAGQTILQGKHLCEGGVTPADWLHFLLAVLFHDIGYVRGVCRNDRDDAFSTGIGDEVVTLSPSGTDIALTPYHVDRSKAFIRERFGEQLLIRDVIDADLVASYIEMTRFPVPTDDDFYKDTRGYPGLVRAADFIGQFGDPSYLRKIPALFYEFEELGINDERGYENPGVMRQNYGRFYWSVVSPYIRDALRYLRATQEGKQWIANLYSHVFAVEHASGR